MEKGLSCKVRAWSRVSHWRVSESKTWSSLLLFWDTQLTNTSFTFGFRIKPISKGNLQEKPFFFPTSPPLSHVVWVWCPTFSCIEWSPFLIEMTKFSNFSKPNLLNLDVHIHCQQILWKKKLNNALLDEALFSIPGNKTFLDFWETLHWDKNCTLFHNKERFSKPSRGTLFENPNNWGVGHRRFWWRNAKGKGSSENGWGRFNWRPKPCLPPAKCIFHPSNNKKKSDLF